MLCDGRNVAGSRYATVTGQTNVPDLRGAFIRAAGQNSNSLANWNGGAVGAFHQDTTRAPRNTAFTGTTTGSTRWSYGDTEIIGNKGGGHDLDPSGGGYGERKSLVTDQHLDHQHNLTINGGGDVETAPVHYGLNTFIKIN